MKSTFVLALSFATVASYAQGEEDPMGRGALPPPDVAHNIVAVAEMLARFFVPEEEAVHNLHGHLKAVETCLRRGDGLKLDLINKFIAGIPKALDCVDMVFNGRNKWHQEQASKCFVKKYVGFTKKYRVSAGQEEKIKNTILYLTCQSSASYCSASWLWLRHCWTRVPHRNP